MWNRKKKDLKLNLKYVPFEITFLWINSKIHNEKQMFLFYLVVCFYIKERASESRWEPLISSNTCSFWSSHLTGYRGLDQMNSLNTSQLNITRHMWYNSLCVILPLTQRTCLENTKYIRLKFSRSPVLHKTQIFWHWDNWLYIFYPFGATFPSFYSFSLSSSTNSSAGKLQLHLSTER